MNTLLTINKDMERYSNSSSGIFAYEIGDAFIRIRFKESGVYTYKVSIIGRSHYNNMVRLAHRGRGLNTYINQNPTVRKGYS